MYIQCLPPLSLSSNASHLLPIGFFWICECVLRFYWAALTLLSWASYSRLGSPGGRHCDGARGTRGFWGSNNCERKKGRKQDRAREADAGTVLSKALPAQYGSSSYIFLLEKFSRNGYDLDPQPGPVIGCRVSWEEHALGYQHLTQAEELPKNVLNLVKKLRQTLAGKKAEAKAGRKLSAHHSPGSCTELGPAWHLMSAPRIAELVASTSLLK